MSGWSTPEYLSALRTALLADATLTGLAAPTVQVFTAWPTADYSVTDALIIGYETNDTVDPSAVGRLRYDEAVNVLCSLRILRAGAGEAKAVEARDRAATVLDAVDALLRAHTVDLAGPDDQIIHQRISAHEMLQFPDPGGGEPAVPLRVCLVDFTITYAARTS